MLNKSFEAVLSKLNERGGDDAHTQVSIKHFHPDPTFFEPMNGIFAADVISLLVDAPEKAKVSYSVDREVTVKFDEVEFDARITEIRMSKKEKKGEVTFDCEIRLEKEIDDMNKLLGIQYLNAKKENDEGKMKPILFSVTISNKAG